MSQHKSRDITDSTHFARPDNPSWARRQLLKLGSLLLALLGSTLNAQPTLPVQSSLDAYQLVDRWIRNWDVPGVDADEIESVPVSAAIVTIRVDGRVLGRGVGVSLDPSSKVLWEAAKGALASAKIKIDHEYDVGHDALWEGYIVDLAKRATLTLEIADTLVPISDSRLELPGFGYTPGVLGVAVRRGDRVELMGPESMLMRNTDMTQSAMALSNALAPDGGVALSTPTELAKLGFKFYRFEPVVLAQPAPAMGAVFLDRGSRVIDESEIGLRSIALLSSKIASHLISRQYPGVEPFGLMGTLDPVTGKSASPSASPFEQGISAYALLRYGSIGTNKNHRNAAIAGKEVLRDLGEVGKDELAPWDDPVGACMALIALSELQLVDILGDESLNTLRTRCLELLDGLYSQDTGFADAVPSASHGLVAHALLRCARLDPRDRMEIARAAIDQVFDQTPAPALVAQMPFLGWAANEMTQGDGELDHADALKQMRELVWAHQLRRADLEWMDRDLEGGIVFTSSSTPLPSWLSLRPLCAIATMLGDPIYTPGAIASGELPIEIAHLIDSIRFINQLTAGDEIGHLYASPKSAKWGVRMAMWDQRMPVEVDAMALLTLSETARSFKDITRRASP